MLWSGIKLKDLRRSLGWHEADLARRLKVTTDCVKAWESGVESVPLEITRELVLLEDQCESCRQSLANESQAEHQMKEQQVNQIKSTEI